MFPFRGKFFSLMAGAMLVTASPDVKAQTSHNIKPNSSCRYVKGPKNHEGMTPCPACTEQRKKNEAAVQAEYKRRMAANNAEAAARMKEKMDEFARQQASERRANEERSKNVVTFAMPAAATPKTSAAQPAGSQKAETTYDPATKLSGLKSANGKVIAPEIYQECKRPADGYIFRDKRDVVGYDKDGKQLFKLSFPFDFEIDGTCSVNRFLLKQKLSKEEVCDGWSTFWVDRYHLIDNGSVSKTTDKLTMRGYNQTLADFDYNALSTKKNLNWEQTQSCHLEAKNRRDQLLSSGLVLKFPSCD